MSMLQHRQVGIRYGPYEAEVDEELAPLIVELWKAGIATVLSCQEVTEGVAWIKFPGSGEAKQFLQVAEAGDKLTIDALPDKKRNASAPTVPTIWGYRVHPQGSVSIRPPRACLEEILARFRALNDVEKPGKS